MERGKHVGNYTRMGMEGSELIGDYLLVDIGDRLYSGVWELLAILLCHLARSEIIASFFA